MVLNHVKCDSGELRISLKLDNSDSKSNAKDSATIAAENHALRKQVVVLETKVQILETAVKDANNKLEALGCAADATRLHVCPYCIQSSAWRSFIHANDLFWNNLIMSGGGANLAMVQKIHILIHALAHDDLFDHSMIDRMISCMELMTDRKIRSADGKTLLQNIEAKLSDPNVVGSKAEQLLRLRAKAESGGF